MALKQKQSGLLQKYQEQYRKNPRSRVFAPLAECYRKLGMMDEALKILKEGLRYNPTYILGYLVLSQCYYDQAKYDLVYDTLRTFVPQSRDNILMQKVFSDVCYRLGFLEEALETYKFLLYLNPKDNEAQVRIKYLEDTLLISQTPIFSHDQTEESNEDDWVQVDHLHENKIDKNDQWVAATAVEVQPQLPLIQDSPLPILPPEKVEKIISIDQLEDSQDKDLPLFEIPKIEELKNKESISLEKNITADEDADHPVMTLTIVDLYIDQGHPEKAKEILNKILEISPNDKRVLAKLKEIDAGVVKEKEVFEIKIKQIEENLLKYSSEDEGHDQLMDLIDNKIKRKKPKSESIIPKLEKFLERIKVVSQIRREANQ